DFVGYIESMLQLSQVKTYQKYIYKVIMNNNRGTKVRVVFWSNKAVEWSSKLSLYQIIEVTGCTVADVKFQYDSDLKGVIAPQELHVQEFSTINVLGMFNQANAIVEQEVIYTETSIETCLEHGRQPIE
ncbi:uncharacterized protein, partial [Fopius arisanus]|uniref:Uncharacterized protein n=1 Tax=Fopius arisanus TaxID=64838 RepID=A0A9R1TPW8_9HYME